MSDGKPENNKQVSVVFIFSRNEYPELEVSIPDSHYSIADFVTFEDKPDEVFKVMGVRHHLVLNGNLSTCKTFVVLAKLSDMEE